MYLLKNWLLFASSMKAFAIGLLICLSSNAPNLITGKLPTTIVQDFIFYLDDIGHGYLYLHYKFNL